MQTTTVVYREQFTKLAHRFARTTTGHFALLVALAITPACSSHEAVDHGESRVTDTTTPDFAASSQAACEEQWASWGRRIQDSSQRIGEAEDSLEEARQRFLGSSTAEEGQRNLVALNLQLSRLSGLFSALAADAELAPSSLFPDVAERFIEAAQELSAAYEASAVAGDPSPIVAARPVMDAAWRALATACE